MVKRNLKTQRRYVYHSTPAENLPDILSKGLRLGKGVKETGLDRTGRLYVTPSLSWLERETSTLASLDYPDVKKFAILRFPASISELVVDEEAEDEQPSYYIRRSIPPEKIRHIGYYSIVDQPGRIFSGIQSELLE